MWLVASYCISFFKKSKGGEIHIRRKQKMQNASFLVLINLSFGFCTVRICFIFSFKSVLQNVTLCYMNVLCFYLFVVCQNEDLKHVAGIVTRLHEENKKCIVKIGESWLLVAGLHLLKVLGAYSKSILRSKDPGVHHDVTTAPSPSRKPIGLWECSQHIWP